MKLEIKIKHPVIPSAQIWPYPECLIIKSFSTRILKYTHGITFTSKRGQKVAIFER